MVVLFGIVVASLWMPVNQKNCININWDRLCIWNSIIYCRFHLIIQLFWYCSRWFCWWPMDIWCQDLIGPRRKPIADKLEKWLWREITRLLCKHFFGKHCVKFLQASLGGSGNKVLQSRFIFVIPGDAFKMLMLLIIFVTLSTVFRLWLSDEEAKTNLLCHSPCC